MNLSWDESDRLRENRNRCSETYKCSIQARLFRLSIEVEEVDGALARDLRGVQCAVAAIAILTRPTLGAPRRALFPAAMASI